MRMMVAHSFALVVACAWPVLSHGSEHFPGPSADIATRANELFNRADTGIAIRMIGLNYTYPWWSCKNHTTPTCAPKDSSRRLSTMLLNKFMVDESVPGGRFPWNRADWKLGGGYTMGYIATDNFTNKHTSCVYPVDGTTFSRNNSGCGPYWGHDEPRWCDPVPQDIVHSEHFLQQDWGYGWDGCYSNRSQFPEVLQAFHDLKTTNNYEFADAWNELVLDGDAWNTDVENSLWAWVATPTCLAKYECSYWFFNYTTEYERAFNSTKPILVLGDGIEEPFSVYPGKSSLVLV